MLPRVVATHVLGRNAAYSYLSRRAPFFLTRNCHYRIHRLSRGLWPAVCLLFAKMAESAITPLSFLLLLLLAQPQLNLPHSSAKWQAEQPGPTVGPISPDQDIFALLEMAWYIAIQPIESACYCLLRDQVRRSKFGVAFAQRESCWRKGKSNSGNCFWNR